MNFPVREILVQVTRYLGSVNTYSIFFFRHSWAIYYRTNYFLLYFQRKLHPLEICRDFIATLEPLFIILYSVISDSNDSVIQLRV